MQDPLQRFRVEGKRALVTGGSKGIGAETAVVLAQPGRMSPLSAVTVPVCRRLQP